ncbi:MAG: neutral/alkaline non-lysosomal ceramidase N-terminal domain-containing protein [Pirellulaceae bacterium]
MPHVDSPQSQVRFAASRADITPPLGIYWRMWGAATHDHAIGVHRPLTATAAIFEPLSFADAGGIKDRVALVSLDHCLLGKEEAELVISAICKRCSVTPSQVLLTFTHTHSAGLMSLDRANFPGGELILPYLRKLADTCAELVEKAIAQAAPAVIAYGVGRCDLAQHRDFWDEENKLFVCGYNPEGRADDTVLTARITNAAGKTCGTLVNYACHPTTLAWENRLISPDYIGAMRETIEGATGGAPCIFLQGASGELGPKEGYVGDVSVAERNGRQLGLAALSALQGLALPLTRFEYQGPVISGATLGDWRHKRVPPEREAEIGAWRRMSDTLASPYRPDLPTREGTEELLAKYTADEELAQRSGGQAAARDARALVERQTRMLRRLSQLPEGTTYPFDLQVWRMGDAVWVAVPGEHYSYLQTNLRARFPGRIIVVITLTGGWGPSYVPTRETYGKGLYQESIAVLSPGSLEKIADELASRIATIVS